MDFFAVTGFGDVHENIHAIVIPEVLFARYADGALCGRDEKLAHSDFVLSLHFLNEFITVSKMRNNLNCSLFFVSHRFAFRSRLERDIVIVLWRRRDPADNSTRELGWFWLLEGVAGDGAHGALIALVTAEELPFRDGLEFL